MVYRNYTNQDIINNSKKAKSIAELLRFLGLKPAGGNYSNIKRKLQQLNVNTEHWTGQGWSKDAQLKNWSEYLIPNSVKLHLIKNRGHKCEVCNYEKWLNNKIKLEIHHVDGNRTNNNIENLQLLCPNCHSMTKNWRRSK